MLDAALAQVAKYGWTVEALSLAAAEQGLSNLAHGLFRRVRRFPPFVCRSGSSMAMLTECYRAQSSWWSTSSPNATLECWRS